MTSTTTLSYADTLHLIELKGIRNNISPSEIARQKKKLELQTYGRTSTCSFYAKKGAVSPQLTKGYHRVGLTPEW